MLGRGLSLAELSRTRSSRAPALRSWSLQGWPVPLSTVTRDQAGRGRKHHVEHICNQSRAAQMCS